MKRSFKVVVSAFLGLTVVSTAGVALAEGETGIAAIFAAVDLSTVASSVETLAVTIIGIGLIFAGLKLAKRILGKA